MPNVVKELDAALLAQLPPLNARFADPATKTAIRAAERKLGVTYPDDLQQFLLGANGQKSRSYTPRGDYIVPRIRITGRRTELSAWGYFLSVKEIVEQTLLHRERAEEDPEVDKYRQFYGPVASHRQHIILTAADDPCSLALDLQPARKGHVGQVVTINDQPDYTACIAPTLSAFLRLLIDGFRAGRYERADDGTLTERA